MRAAMVSTDVQIAMFGGLNAMNAAPAPTVFHETWVFDGKYWTHRQDIGPSPRWAHAMACDTARRSIVLFGGLPVLAAQGDGKAAAQLLGDTWEHVETDAPSTPAPGPAPAPAPAPGGGPVVIELGLTPSSVAPGNSVIATVSLDRTPAAATPVELAWVPQHIVDAANAAHTGIPPGDIHLLTVINIAAGSSTGSGTFAAPNTAGPVVVFADAGSGTTASAILTITGG